MSDEKVMDIDNKLINYLKITRIVNNVFGQQNTLNKNNKITQPTDPSSVVIRE
jgi:hypothetical protein